MIKLTLKKLALMCLLATATFNMQAQNDSSNNYVKGFLTIPSFNINIVPDNTFYSNDKLDKSKPFMIMLFSPDCDHCQKQTKDMLAQKDKLSDIQILMVSLLPNADNRKFYEEYGLNKMPNIKLGSDVSFRLLKLYNTSIFPSMYVYDKNGNLAKAFVGNVNVAAIIDAVK